MLQSGSRLGRFGVRNSHGEKKCVHNKYLFQGVSAKKGVLWKQGDSLKTCPVNGGL
jgi:hypothetical protein